MTTPRATRVWQRMNREMVAAIPGGELNARRQRISALMESGEVPGYQALAAGVILEALAQGEVAFFVQEGEGWADAAGLDWPYVQKLGMEVICAEV